MVLRFWLGFTYGGSVGHGETYLNEQDQLWWLKGGELYGGRARRGLLFSARSCRRFLAMVCCR